MSLIDRKIFMKASCSKCGRRMYTELKKSHVVYGVIYIDYTTLIEEENAFYCRNQYCTEKDKPYKFIISNNGIIINPTKKLTNSPIS